MLPSERLKVALMVLLLLKLANTRLLTTRFLRATGGVILVARLCELWQPTQFVTKAPCGAGDQHNNRMKREGVSRCSHLSTGAATAPSGEQ